MWAKACKCGGERRVLKDAHLRTFLSRISDCLFTFWSPLGPELSVSMPHPNTDKMLGIVSEAQWRDVPQARR